MSEPILNLHDVEEFFVLSGLYDFLKGGETVIEDIIGILPNSTQIFYDERLDSQFFKLIDKGVFEVIGGVGSGSDDTYILLTKEGYIRALDIYQNNGFIHNAVLSQEKKDISRLLPPHHSYEDFLSLRRDSTGNALELARRGSEGQVDGNLVGHNSGSVIDFSKYDEEITQGLKKVEGAYEAIRADNQIGENEKSGILNSIRIGLQIIQERLVCILSSVREPILNGLKKGLEIATSVTTVTLLTAALTWATAFFAGLG